MALSMQSISHSMQYQENHTSGRQISAAPNQPLPEDPQNSLITNHGQNTPSVEQFSSQSIMATLTQSSSFSTHSTTNQSSELPLLEDEKLIKLLLAQLIQFLNPDKSSDEIFAMLEPSDDVKDITQIGVPNTPVIEIVSVDDQAFSADTVLNVTEWQAYSQSLSFQMHGEFTDNDQLLSLSYSFTLESSYISANSFQVTAGELTDPLVIQFGKQALGHIKGTSQFSLNESAKDSQIPIFSGDVGYLVHDQNGNSKADNGSELFGPQTGQGFSELSQLDEDNNGFIDKNDSSFDNLFIWQPESINGWQSLSKAGIRAISTQAIETPFSFLNDSGQEAAKMRNSSFAITNDDRATGVHQVDIQA